MEYIYLTSISHFDIIKVENIFSSLMGNKAELRYKFITEKANFVTNVDI